MSCNLIQYGEEIRRLILIPSKKMWKDAVEKDEDLQKSKQTIDNRIVTDKKTLVEKKFNQPFKEGRLAHKDGEWYDYEKTKKARVGGAERNFSNFYILLKNLYY